MIGVVFTVHETANTTLFCGATTLVVTSRRWRAPVDPKARGKVGFNLKATMEEGNERGLNWYNRSAEVASTTSQKVPPHAANYVFLIHDERNSDPERQ